ncbi:MAG: formate dehydrogenase accessory sulfurtransferase FdhD [Capsulimonadales bacterium]|nr:formate dehydrogenase accessory sulfurtransferase FdhD [Capsulimonadales bacterium]
MKTVAERRVQFVNGTERGDRDDVVAVEEPLEIRLGFGPIRHRQVKTIAYTMRTPGDDTDLALGFLWSEGILPSADAVLSVQERAVTETGFAGVVQVDLTPDALPKGAPSERSFVVNSACGVCGSSSVAAVQTHSPFDLSTDGVTVTPDVVLSAPDRLRKAQETFDRTGGLHAAGLFSPEGELLTLREDVGRHNAVDKLTGCALSVRNLPLTGTMLMVSGRTSFELVRKAVMAGIPILAAVGAPSSLAVDLAQESDLTLLGFVRGNRFNIYSGGQRIAG